jgi:hypothetical protein
MTNIVPVSRTSITFRGLQTVDVWLKTNNRMNLVENGDFNVSGENGRILSEIRNILRLAKETIVVTSTRIDATLSEEIIDAAKNGIRVYFLLGNDGFDDWLKSDFKDIADCVLCRRSSVAIPSLVLVDGETQNAKGILLQSGTAIDRSLKVEGTAWGLNLNSEQVNQLAHHVSWVFWSSKGPRSETRCANHLKAPKDTTSLQETLNEMPENTNISVKIKIQESEFFSGINNISEFSAIGFSEFDLRDIGGVEIDRNLKYAILPLPGEVRSGNISADSRASNIVALISSDGTIGWIFDWIADAKMQANHQVALRLNSSQAKSLNSIIIQSYQNSEWNYRTQVELSKLEVGSEVRLPDGKTNSKIMDKQTIDLGEQIVTPWDKERLREFEPHPASKPDTEPFVMNVEWKWKNVPTCPPKDAKLDLTERQFSEAIQKAEKAETYLRQRLISHEKKGEKELKKLDKATEKLPDNIRLASDIEKWINSLKDSENSLKNIEDEGDSDIQRKKKTKEIDIPSAPSENRPLVGKLMAHGKQRFLAIDSWDDFETGVSESEKHNAELCATRDVLNRKPE